jgi:hypothetical protein
MNNSPVETKVAAGSFATVLTGLITWIVTAYLPSLKTVLPPTLAGALPMAAGWLIGTLAAYRAPHTPRPLGGPGLVQEITAALDQLLAQRFRPKAADLMRTQPPAPAPVPGQPTAVIPNVQVIPPDAQAAGGAVVPS